MPFVHVSTGLGMHQVACWGRSLSPQSSTRSFIIAPPDSQGGGLQLLPFGLDLENHRREWQDLFPESDFESLSLPSISNVLLIGLCVHLWEEKGIIFFQIQFWLQRRVEQGQRQPHWTEISLKNATWLLLKHRTFSTSKASSLQRIRHFKGKLWKSF